MTLHEAIAQVLLDKRRPMTARKIADLLNKNSWYTKKDTSLIRSSQIGARVKNYPHLFNKNGPLISLKGKTGLLKVFTSPKLKASLVEINSNSTLKIKDLMNEKNFKSASGTDNLVPDKPGLYCIRILSPRSLSAEFAQALEERNHNIIYIGIASQSLRKRFLGQELRARGHGTFFRSIGAVLGYRPEPGSLLNKKNQNNYTFSQDDEKKIIKWINQNLIVNWIATEGDLKGIENKLIKEHLPLLNIAGNPGAIKKLEEMREECKRIGRGKSLINQIF